MADSAAERVRRSRAHKKGDHSLCVFGRCDAVTEIVTPVTPEPVTQSREPRKPRVPRTPPAPAVVTPSEPVTPQPPEAPAVEEAEPEAQESVGEIEAETQAFVDALKFADGDPRRLLGRLAVRLARRIDESGAAPAAIRELRVLLAQIAEIPEGPAGPLDVTRSKRALRRIDGLLRAAT